MKLIPHGRHNVDKKDIIAVSRVVGSDFLTQGPKVSEFEKKIAAYCRAKYAVAVSSGTAALHLAYLVSGITKNDEVITTPNTFVATSNMLMILEAKPVFCDIRLDTHNIDESKIEKLITRKTKAIVPVHFAGHPCEMDKILKLAKKHKLILIEDACHALGASYRNKKIGNIGDMTIFSFHPVKSITTGEGGAILTDDKNYYHKLLELRSHGVHKDENGFNVMTQLGYNYRLTDIQATLGLSQLKKLDNFIKLRHAVAFWYNQYLKDIKKIILPTELYNNYSAWHIYVIRTQNQTTRNNLAQYLKSGGIGINFHYPAVYGHPYYRNNGFKNTYLTNEETYHKTCITLPLHTHLKQKDIKYIADKIKEYYANN